MEGTSRCQQCDATLTGQAVGGLCANCLLKLALEPAAEPTVMEDKLPPASAQSIRVRYFGDYELVEEIARGGMGVVYKARQVSLNRIVAVKMILAGDFSSPALVERFQTEAEAAARLEHPNIVPIFEIGEHEGRHYFSMGYVEGGSLTQALARRKFSPRLAAELLVKVALAVHHAHQRGILHRDLKPGNILLDAEGGPHVADFGLARVVEHDSSLTQSAAVMGTPSYMAPEQAAGQTKQATTAVDIYSLGAIFYEMLTCRPPFVGGSALEILMQACEREPVPPRSLRPEVDRDLGVICLKCLEKDPERRYRSAAGLADDLQRWLSNEPIQARRTTLVERTVKWARRKPVVAGLIVALHLTAVAGLIGILWQTALATAEAKRANVEAGNARQEWSRAESELWNANFSEARALRIAGGSGARVLGSALLRKLVQRPGFTETQTLSLREEAIAQLALVDVAMPTKWIPAPEESWLAWDSGLNRYARDAGANRVDLCEFPSERVLATFHGPPDAVFDQAVFSPDDQFLAVRFSNAGGEVRVWKLDTRKLILQSICERFGDSWRLCISPDCRTLAMLTDQGLAVQAIAAGSTRRLLHEGRVVNRVTFSPDSKHVAVLPADLRETVEIWDAGSGKTRCSFRLGFNPHEIAWHPDGNRLLMGGDRGRLEIRTIDREDVGVTGANRPFPLDGHLGYIERILVAPNGSAAITNSWDDSSIFWDLTSGQPLLREQRIKLRGISSAGDRVLARRELPPAETVTSVVQRSGYRTISRTGEARSSHGVWTSPDGRLVAVNCDSHVSHTEGDLRLCDFSSGLEISSIKGVWAQFSPDSRSLFTFERFAENRVRRYDVSEETLRNPPALWSEGSVVYEGNSEERIHTGTLSSDGHTLVIAATDAVIFLDTLCEQPTWSWEKPAYAAVPSNDGKWVVTMRHHEQGVLRAAHSGEAVLRLEKYSHVKVSPDSRWMAVTTQGAVQIYQLSTLLAAYPPITLEAGSGTAPPLEFSRDSRMFAVPWNRTQVRLYETSTGRELATLIPPNPAPITGSKALEFSADGQWLLAARDNGETVAWQLPVIRGELAKLRLDWE